MEDVVTTTVAYDYIGHDALLSYYNIDTISYQGVLLSAVIVEPFHVVTLTLSTIQNGWTALKEASLRGHHKVVEVLLGAGANPNLQNKVSTGQNMILHRCLNFGIHPLLLCMILVMHYRNIYLCITVHTLKCILYTYC